MAMKCCRKYATLCRFLTILWLIAAVVFSALAVGSCEFAKRGGSTFGLFSYGWGADGLCLNTYPDGFPHGWLHAWAAVCGALAPILGAIVVLFMLMDCFCKVRCSAPIQSLLLTGAELSQAFTFLMYTSDACHSKTEIDLKELETIIWGGCKIGQGSIFSFVAIGCYFVGGCFLCLSPKHDPLVCSRRDGDAARKPRGKEERVFPDEENAAAVRAPRSPSSEVRPQLY